MCLIFHEQIDDSSASISLAQLTKVYIRIYIYSYSFLSNIAKWIVACLVFSMCLCCDLYLGTFVIGARCFSGEVLGLSIAKVCILLTIL